MLALFLYYYLINVGIGKIKMSSEKFYIKKYSDRLYGLDEDHKSAGFLVIGDERACLIDTMFGKEYSFEDIRKLTDKEIIVINTHGHADHVLGNIHFEKAYIHKADQKIAIKACTTGKLLFPKRIFKGKYAEFENIAEGDSIDLGGLELKIYDLPGHTPGGIVVLCPQLRVLFSGDGINHHLFMWLKDSIPMEEMVNNLKRLRPLMGEADIILHGHSMEQNDISLIDSLINGAEEIIEGKTENDTVISFSGQKVRKHAFEVDANGTFNSDEHFIFYPFR